MHKTIVLRLFHIINHLLVIYGLMFHWNLSFLFLSFFIYALIGSFGISIGYHRYLSHKSFQPRGLFQIFCIFWGIVSTGGSPISWAAAHRIHHQHSDTDLDIHFLARDGFFRVYFHHWHPFVVSRRLVRDLIRVRWLRWIHQNYFMILILYAGGLYLCNFKIGVYIYSLPAIMAFHFYGMINVLGHCFGKRPLVTNDTSSNNWFINIFTFGEGWHQNHHLLPSSHRIGLRNNELDFSAWMLENLPFSKDRGRLREKKDKNIAYLDQKQKELEATIFSPIKWPSS